MNTLIDLQSQIEKLQKQATELKAKEFDSTVAEIRAKMTAFGITAKDLQTIKRGARKGKQPKAGKAAAPGKATRGASKVAGKPVAAKFAGPNGESWTGRGLTPRWLSTLISEGRSKEEFAIKN